MATLPSATIPTINIATTYPNAAGFGIATYQLLKDVSMGTAFSGANAAGKFALDALAVLSQGVSFVNGAVELAQRSAPSLAKNNFVLTSLDVSAKLLVIIDKLQNPQTRGDIKLADIFSVIGGVADLSSNALMKVPGTPLFYAGVFLKGVNAASAIGQVYFGETKLSDQFSFLRPPTLSGPRIVVDDVRIYRNNANDSDTIIVKTRDAETGLITFAEMRGNVQMFKTEQQANGQWKTTSGQNGIGTPVFGSVNLLSDENIASRLGQPISRSTGLKPIAWTVSEDNPDSLIFGGEELNTLGLTNAIAEAFVSVPGTDLNLVSTALGQKLLGQDLNGALASYNFVDGFTVHLANGNLVSVNQLGQSRSLNVSRVDGETKVAITNFDGTLGSQSTDQSGYSVTEFANAAGQLTFRQTSIGNTSTTDTYSAPGIRDSREVRELTPELFRVSIFDGDLKPISVTEVRLLPDRSRVETVRLTNDTVTETKFDPAGVSVGSVFTTTLGTNTNQTFRDGSGNLVKTETTQRFDEGPALRVISFADGSEVRQTGDYSDPKNPIVYTSQGTAPPMQQLGSALQDINTIIQQIRGGASTGLVATSGLRLLNNQVNPVVNGSQIVNNAPLFTTTAIANGFASIYSIDRAFSTSGNYEGKLSATLNGIVAINAAANAVQGAISGTVNAVASTALNGVASSISNALPFVNIALAIKSGDPVGIGVAVASAMGFPVIGWIYAAYQIITAITSSPPEAWGVAKVTFSTAGGTSINVDVVGDASGPGKVKFLFEGNGKPATDPQYFGGLLAYLNETMVRQQQANPEVPLGIIPQRLPTISWRESRLSEPGYSITDINPLTGEEIYPNLRYNDNFMPYNADALNQVQRRSVFERMIDSAVARQAIAPLACSKTKVTRTLG
jgi:hypothetical protein